VRQAVVITILLCMIPGLYGEDYTKLKFSLKGVGGKSYTQDIFKQETKKIFFFFFPHCRFSKKFYKFISDLTGTPKNQFAIYLVSPNYKQSFIPDDLAYTDVEINLEGMKTVFRRHQFKAPFISDGESQIITKALEVNTTPTAVFLDEQNRLLYKGKIGEITPKGSVDTSYFEEIIRGNNSNKTIVTKVRGSEIKTREDLPNTTRILKRYANETVKLVDADKEKIEFFKKFHNRKVALFFIWNINDKESRENLLKITEVYKIYRKRGLSLITICISQDKERILENLKLAQSSGYNFKSDFYQVNQIFNLSGINDQITPSLLAVDKAGLIKFKIQDNIEILDLRSRVLKLLD